MGPSRTRKHYDRLYLKRQRLNNDHLYDKIVLEAIKPIHRTLTRSQNSSEELRIASCKKTIWLWEHANKRLLLIRTFDFKVNFYNNILDIAVNSVSDRFEWPKDTTIIGFFSWYDVHELKVTTYENLLKTTAKICGSFRHTWECSADINGLETTDELGIIIPNSRIKN